jgi:hypothetical protein
VILLAVAAGGSRFGIAGAYLAVPVTAVVSVCGADRWAPTLGGVEQPLLLDNHLLDAAAQAGVVHVLTLASADNRHYGAIQLAANAGPS